MTRLKATGFDRYFDQRMKDPAFAAEYEKTRREIDTVDEFVRALDAAREAAGLTKTALAKRVNMKPEVVRRLFTAEAPNPTLETVVKLAGALNLSLGLVRKQEQRPARKATTRAPRA